MEFYRPSEGYKCMRVREITRRMESLHGMIIAYDAYGTYEDIETLRPKHIPDTIQCLVYLAYHYTLFI